MPLPAALRQFLASVHPYDCLPDSELEGLANACEVKTFAAGETIFSLGQEITHLLVIVEGEVEITDETGVQLSILGPRNSFGERALLRGDRASRTAMVIEPATIIAVPSDMFFALIEAHEAVALFFDRRRPPRQDGRKPCHHARCAIDDARSNHLHDPDLDPGGGPAVA